MIRFDRFMEAALYHPERGYYTSRIKSVGSRGDFTTTPQLSKALGRAIAKTFRDSGCRHLIEVGPGTGLLAKTIRESLPFFANRRLKQHLVEVSPPLRKLQREANPKASHHHSMEEALTAVQGDAFIYSNELVDAFPVRIFRRENQGYSELHLTGSHPTITEHFEPLPELPDSRLFEQRHLLYQRIEVHESYYNWLKQWTPLWKSGQLLTIDYTPTDPRQLDGTLRGYFLQDRLTGVNLYQNAGHIDLTADVEFDDLDNWGKALNLRTLKRQKQSEYLRPFVASSAQDCFLTDVDGAGSAFEILLQEKTSSRSNSKSKKQTSG